MKRFRLFLPPIAATLFSADSVTKGGLHWSLAIDSRRPRAKVSLRDSIGETVPSGPAWPESRLHHRYSGLAAAHF